MLDFKTPEELSGRRTEIANSRIFSVLTPADIPASASDILARLKQAKRQC
jgi:putative IMPACT (imprinted ancient) family translation regulator